MARKWRRDDLNNPNKSSNSAWDGRKVKIFGARNEIIAFQLIVEADDNGINRLIVTLPQLDAKRRQGQNQLHRTGFGPDKLYRPPNPNIFRQLHER